MIQALHPLLASRTPYFKLICGANFTDYRQLSYLTCVYTLAGAAIIDVAATPEAVQAAKAGLQMAREWAPLLGCSASNPLVMVSVTASDDPHCRIAVKVEDRCTWTCPHCLNACPHDAIDWGLNILADRCVGCTLCVPACPYDALYMAHAPFNPSLDRLWDEGARALELHTGSGDRTELERWRSECERWVERGGLFSLSVNPVQLGEQGAVELARELCAWLPEHRIIVQADGNPISGQAGERSTRPALDFAKRLLDAHIPAAIQPAGGANDKTAPLARRLGISIAGIGVGSYARCIIGVKTEAEPSREALVGDLRRATELVASIQPKEV